MGTTGDKLEISPDEEESPPQQSLTGFAAFRDALRNFVNASPRSTEGQVEGRPTLRQVFKANLEAWFHQILGDVHPGHFFSGFAILLLLLALFRVRARRRMRDWLEKIVATIRMGTQIRYM